MTTVVNGFGTLSLSVTGRSAAGSPTTLTVASLPDSVQVGQYIYVSGVAGVTAGEYLVTARTSTTVTFTFSATGAYVSGGTIARKYTSVPTWNTATAVNCVATTTSYVLETYDDGDITVAAADWTISGATVNATYYRSIRCWRGSATLNHRYDTASRDGVRISKSLTGTYPSGIVVSENYFRLSGFLLECTDGGGSAGTRYGVRITADAVRVDGVTLHMKVGASTSNTWDGFRCTAGGGASGTKRTFTNCVVVGSGVDGVGVINGFRSSTAYDVAYNCDALNCSGGSPAGAYPNSGHGFNITGANSLVRNCISIGAGLGDFVLTSVAIDNSISGDTSLSLTPTCFASRRATDVYFNPAFDDLRVRFGSSAQDNGVDLTALFTTDILGTLRSGAWEIGAYQGTAPAALVSPTVVVKTIGSGKDYATPFEFEAASRLNLEYRNEIWRGEMYGDAVMALGLSTAVFSGAVTSQRCYRELRAAEGHAYDPIYDRGVKITSSNTAIDNREDGFRISGCKITMTDTSSSGTYYGVLNTGDRVAIENLFVVFAGGTGGTRTCIDSTGDYVKIRNCIVVGGDGSNGASIGIIARGLVGRVSGCLAYKIRRGAATFFSDGGVAGTWFQNCVGGGGTSAGGDVVFSVTTNYQSNNASQDSTAVGVTSVTMNSEFVSPASNDFRLLSTSQLIDRGVNLKSDLSDGYDYDFAGNPRGASWEIGPYADYLRTPTRPAIPLTTSSRRAKLFSICREDGTVVRVTDHSSPIVWNGQTFSAAATISSSARRHHVAEEGNFEAQAVLNSALFTRDDLYARKFDRAVVYEYDVDWLYPFRGARISRQYAIIEIAWDGEVGRMQLGSMAQWMQRVVGDRNSWSCRLSLYGQGNGACNVDKSSFTAYQMAVDSVVDTRLEFVDATLAGESVGYYQFGEVVWLTGANVGVRSVVRSYDDGTGGLSLFYPTPFDIQVGDAFNASAGCAKTMDACRDTFGNYKNFGGKNFLPGMRKLMQSPQR